MKVSGKIVKVENSTYRNKEGEEVRVKTVILQEVTSDEFKNEYVFELFGEKADSFEFTENQIVKISFGFKVESRQYPEKIYYRQKLIFYRAEVV